MADLFAQRCGALPPGAGAGGDAGGAMFRSWMGISSVLTVVMLVFNTLRSYLPRINLPFRFNRYYRRYARNVAAFVDPYISISFPEYEADRFKRSEAFKEVLAYLAAATASTSRNLRAETAKDSDRFLLSMGDDEEVLDVFEADIVVSWMVHAAKPKNDRPPWYCYSGEERRTIFLFFHERHRDAIVSRFLPHVRQEGRAVMKRNRRRKLYTNIAHSGGWDEGYRKSGWTHVPFEHPSTFDTIAMDPEKKKEIIDDLDTFRKSKEFYRRIGKAWKRGYLLHGPPGTGKSTMIAAMANYLDYDIYDLELTSVSSNTELRKLFIETTGKSIIVIEDIDCSLDLTGKREKKKAKAEAAATDPASPAAPPKPEGEKEGSKVTLSGLLNFIDGLWSACGEERLLVFTTNYFEKLDPALIRTGRMDKHIEMSYCCFEAFKFLAKKYHPGVGDEHPLLADVAEVLERGVKMTPADVAEKLMPKRGDDDAESCLRRLLKALEDKEKEDAAKAAEEKAAKEKEAEAANKAEQDSKPATDEEKKKSDAKAVSNGEAVKSNGTVEEEEDEASSAIGSTELKQVVE